MTRGDRGLNQEYIADIVLSAIETVEKEKNDIEAQRDSLSGVLYLEKVSYAKGKLHTLNAIYDALKIERK